MSVHGCSTQSCFFLSFYFFSVWPQSGGFSSVLLLCLDVLLLHLIDHSGWKKINKILRSTCRKIWGDWVTLWHMLTDFKGWKVFNQGVRNCPSHAHRQPLEVKPNSKCVSVYEWKKTWRASSVLYKVLGQQSSSVTYAWLNTSICNWGWNCKERRENPSTVKARMLFPHNPWGRHIEMVQQPVVAKAESCSQFGRQSRNA